MLRVKAVSGRAVTDYIGDVARLRMAVFREFPYLYDGSSEYEKQYLQTYIDCDQSVVVLALDGAHVVGASTAIPMAFETEEIQQPLLAAGYDLDKVFYCAESVLLPQYRGKGLGWRFFDEREAHAARLGGFAVSCFCAVERPADHPLRPAGYKTLESLWHKRGYRQQALRAHFLWKDIDQPGETDKAMVYWMKRLDS
ncbi:MAG: GNAT family acetyltransferase [Halioglobus sp.]|nr:GNAT family acetyltransferase [Halioglobus sp.]